jgi:release factor glutamine methyltransferase
MTVAEAVRHVSTLLTAADVDTPRLDAELLIAHACGWERRQVLTYPERDISTAAGELLRTLVARRQLREPLAYLLGEWEFYGRPFTVTSAVLVPRPETEMLVEAGLKWVRQHDAHTVVDVGTGSGIIAITLAAEQPDLSVVAVDLSPEALLVAKGNAWHHGVGEQIHFIEGDLLAPLAGRRVEMVLANLPYIPEVEYRELMPEVRDYEPALALRGGEDGLSLVRRLCTTAPDYLIPGGLLGMELGEGQAHTVVTQLNDSGWQHIRIIEDYGGIARHVLAERG